jgi:hypothetical protein
MTLKTFSTIQCMVFDIWLTLCYSIACSSNSLYVTQQLTLASVNNKWQNFCLIWSQ